ncbi:Crp/Fnr family transcriptional regulator [Aureisphaera galaxeae]|uniref:Crp/Fnr family transcriptional regulator n=1 Tax=Aureisphaera galaxeae TaxID=1538023 RepID=UPI002350081F|nr:Crp/Fnr family transcriptional regulator [Aureisphaera galaxeae]MDC8003863.1 Crp/Fnr family transcriptional regulator [Aureisphaera galaxeae]
MTENDTPRERYFDVFIEQFPLLSEEAKQFTRSILTLKEYGKHDFVFKNGAIQRTIGYVYQGLLRKYYINEKGKKINTGFICEGGYATDYPSFLRQKPTKYYIECLEPSIIVNMSYDDLQEVYNRSKGNEMYGRLIAEQVLIRETDRVESLLFETAEERYLNFISNNKNIMNRISLTDLASFLGMERQSLSRIRSNLAKR